MAIQQVEIPQVEKMQTRNRTRRKPIKNWTTIPILLLAVYCAATLEAAEHPTIRVNPFDDHSQFGMGFFGVAEDIPTTTSKLAECREEQVDRETATLKPRLLEERETSQLDPDHHQAAKPDKNKPNASEDSLRQTATAADGDWKQKDAPIQTRWAKELTVENAWTEYPRPQLVRDQWTNLNGLWEYAVTSRGIATAPQDFDGKILVPFSIESPLSGVGREVNQDEVIWYRRNFNAGNANKKARTILHFEAADWQTTVWINGKKIGNHQGGYAPFSFDITDALDSQGEDVLLVKLWDPQTRMFKSLGKQNFTPENYQRCSGIWQTVWMENVDPQSIARLKIHGSADGWLEVNADLLKQSSSDIELSYEVLDQGEKIVEAKSTGEHSVRINVPDAKLWSPESPFLYDLRVTVRSEGKVTDRVASYFGMRTVALGPSNNGTQILLNAKPIFQIGPLDQNYWPGGGLTPPSDEAMKWECKYLKDIGCNMVRLNVKQNPRRWYTHCDQLGLLVWQDFVSAQTMRQNNKRRAIKPFESKIWMAEQAELMDTLYNHPSIIMWIVFNESWGQHNSASMTKWVMGRDPTRLVNVASGWFDLPGLGHIRDVHDFTFHPSIPVLGSEMKRASILGECGGFASAVPPHNWTGRNNQVGESANPLRGGVAPGIPRDNNVAHDIFRPTFTHGKSLEKQYEAFVEDLCLLKSHGLTAAVYAQLTDMKLEENGWLTFDREVSKMDVSRLSELHARLHGPVKLRQPIIKRMDRWEFALLKPKQSTAPNQLLRFSNEPDFSDAEWEEGRAPFGNSRAYRYATPWDGKKRLVLRHSFNLDQVPKAAAMQFYTYLKGTPLPDGSIKKEWQHARVYLNGKFVLDESTSLIDPEQRVAEINLRPEILQQLKTGENTIVLEVIPALDPNAGKIGDVANEVYFDFSFFEITDAQE